MLCMKRKNNLVIRFPGSPGRRLNPQTRKPTNPLTRELANPRTKKGFTLIEMIMVSALLAVMSLAIYATFNNGMKIWQRVNQSIAEEDLNIFLDKFSGDLRNSFKFTGTKFLGKEDGLEFATLVDSAALQKRSVGKIIYFYDPTAEALSREYLDFSQVYSGENNSHKQSLKNIRALKFQYYLYDPQKKEYLWQDEWLKEELPLAVRIELEFNNGTVVGNFTRTVGIPVSG